MTSKGITRLGSEIIRRHRSGGVTIDHCAQLSRQLGDILDVKDIVPHPYILEVSSPGLNRILKEGKRLYNLPWRNDHGKDL